jgi:uncharacterized protein YdaT
LPGKFLMPWTVADAPSTVKGKQSRQMWAHIANSELRAGRKEGAAKRIASATMKKRRRKAKRKARKR